MKSKTELNPDRWDFQRESRWMAVEQGMRRLWITHIFDFITLNILCYVKRKFSFRNCKGICVKLNIFLGFTALIHVDILVGSNGHSNFPYCSSNGFRYQTSPAACLESTFSCLAYTISGCWAGDPMAINDTHVWFYNIKYVLYETETFIQKLYKHICKTKYIPRHHIAYTCKYFTRI